jgi:RNA polymerase sigma factor for flagellar operon FliA
MTGERMITESFAAGPAVTPMLAAAAFGGAATARNAGTPDRDALVAKYAHLVKYVVGRIGVSIPGVFDHEDAMQAGVIGLLRAIDGYRTGSDASFESYAIVRIRGAILDAVRALDTVGRAGREAGRQIHGSIARLQAELGRSPTEPEIAGDLGLTVGRYRERLQAATFTTVSLDELDGHDDDTSLADTAADPRAVDPLEEATLRDEFATLTGEVTRLGDRQRQILALYYQDGLTFREIGEVLGVTESRICQIHTQTILGLRARLGGPDTRRRLSRQGARR